jgi:glycerophosphoryl diester phosphodiesterase
LPRVARYAIGIGPSRADTDERLVRAAHAAGLLVHPWTVNEPMQIRRFERIGVDGIFTDFPDRIPRKQNP